VSILIVGASHRSAPVELLEQLAVDSDAAAKLRTAALHSDHVTEALVLATCNRVEIYAEVDRFHGSVEDLTALLVERADTSLDDVVPALYVHYDEAAVDHLFSVAAGLDSMVVGEGQILGQVREALQLSQTEETVGPALNTLFQQGLRVGKRAHSETGIDKAGQSLVSIALEEATAAVGPLEGARVSLVGAGSIAALAAASVRRAGAGDITICSRTLANAQRLADSVGGTGYGLADLVPAMAEADLIISCTGATGVVVPDEVMREAMTVRTSEAPVAVIDLALPHDVAPSVTDIPGLTLIALRNLADHAHNAARDDVDAVKAIVIEEVTAYAAARDAARIAPTVVALRTMATGVVAAELERLWGRLDDLTPEQRSEIEYTLRRVADKLLHEPTVRIKQFAGRIPDSSYAEALVELFALDPSAVEAVTRAGEKE
jgi:glutamyl-tRNA reductase